jgi:peptidoglycan hydrolase-like protein with peptidoglycan-binding domain
MEENGSAAMKMVVARIWVFSLLLGSVLPLGDMAQAQPATAAAPQDQDVQATRELVREIQFMLLRLGLDPGPLDGYPRQLTNGAVRRFEQTYGLPLVDLEPGGTVPGALLARLRAEAARAMFGAAGKAEPAPAAIAPPPLVNEAPPPTPATTATVPAPSRPPPADRFALCAYDPDDFHIGANRYTPETFLKEGFDGSTARAVANLKDRLEEGRQIADKIGLTALKEVQRQARVLQYFECRLKIEQASASKS